MKVALKKSSLIFIFCLWFQYLGAQVTLPSLNLLFKPKISIDSSFTFYTFTQQRKFNPGTQPIFCKFEHRWSNLSGINIRMRLGSLEYVDKLENK